MLPECCRLPTPACPVLCDPSDFFDIRLQHRKETKTNATTFTTSHLYRCQPLTTKFCLQKSSIMIQRTILRSSQQAARSLTRPQSQFASIRQPTSSAIQAAPPALRWYSEAPAAVKEGDAATKETAGQATPQDTEGAKLREQLSQKDKEIIDLKVRTLTIPFLKPFRFNQLR